jgi:hypothetical protein
MVQNTTYRFKMRCTDRRDGYRWKRHFASGFQMVYTIWYTDRKDNLKIKKVVYKWPIDGRDGLRIDKMVYRGKRLFTNERYGSLMVEVVVKWEKRLKKHVVTFVRGGY